MGFFVDVRLLAVLGDYINTEEVYEDITNAATLKKKMVDLLAEYNNSPGVVRMDLVLFRDAIDHGIFSQSLIYTPHTFSALTLSVGRQEEHPACEENGAMSCWRGYLRGTRCR